MKSKIDDSAKAILELRQMQSQIIHGSNMFGEIADVIQRMGNQLDALLNHCGKDGGECSECGKIICPHGGEMHFHHDGCPSCCYPKYQRSN